VTESGCPEESGAFDTKHGRETESRSRETGAHRLVVGSRSAIRAGSRAIVERSRTRKKRPATVVDGLRLRQADHPYIVSNVGVVVLYWTEVRRINAPRLS